MNATNSATPASPTPPADSSKRLVVLLCLLGVMIAALGYDLFVARPSIEKAKDRIDETVEKKVFAGVEEGADVKNKATLLTTDKDIQQAIGFAPNWTRKEGNYTLQCYHWWGPLSLPRSYLIVRYRGTEPLLYVDYTDGKMPEGDPAPPEFNGDPRSSGTAMGPPMGGGPPGTGAPPAEETKSEGDEKKAGETPDDASEKPAEEKPAAATPTDDKPAETADPPKSADEKEQE